MLGAYEAVPDDLRVAYDRGWITPEQSYDPLRDQMLVLKHHHQLSGPPEGILCLRPMAYAHSFSLAIPDLRHANVLWQGAYNWAKANGLHGSVFQIHERNARMRRFLESKGGVIEQDAQLARYDIIPARR